LSKGASQEPHTLQEISCGGKLCRTSRVKDQYGILAAPAFLSCINLNKHNLKIQGNYRTFSFFLQYSCKFSIKLGLLQERAGMLFLIYYSWVSCCKFFSVNPVSALLRAAFTKASNSAWPHPMIVL
jgi:hypothetical protein